MDPKNPAVLEFISEAEELLETISSDLLEVEAAVRDRREVNPNTVNKLFREFHSLKGLSGMLGFKNITDLCHDLEDLLDKLRMGKVAFAQEVVDLLFESQELLTRLVGAVGEGQAESISTTGLISKIHQAATGRELQEAATLEDLLDIDEQTLKALTEYEEHRLRENLKKQANLLSVLLALDFANFDQRLKEANEAVGSVGEIISTLPSTDAVAEDKICFNLIIGTSETAEAIADLLGIAGEDVRNIKKKGTTPAAPPPEATERPEEGADAPADASIKSISGSVRVDINKLDHVMNMVGELVVSWAEIDRISRELTARAAHGDLTLQMTKGARNYERKLDELQRAVIDIRMVPIGQIFHKLARAVRKISREFDKEIKIQFYGEETELDKAMIEEITNPLLHIIRNSIDHGVEPPDRRETLGKPREGHIHLRAYQKGNSVLVEVEDDGAGVDPEKVRQAAVAKGLREPEAPITMEEAIDTIFQPGFSSAETVTDVSGRGVGLDVVRKNILDLKGSINVHSVQGEGSTFQITLPITLAIIPTLVVRCREETFAIPLNSVQESLRIRRRDIQTVERREVYYLRNQTVPLLHLDRFFRLNGGGAGDGEPSPDAAAAPAALPDAAVGEGASPQEPDRPAGGNGAGPLSAARDKVFVVVVQAADKRFGIVVDRLLGQREVVIKSIGRRLANLPGVAGSAELGEHQTILVLDVSSMVEAVISGRGAV